MEFKTEKCKLGLYAMKTVSICSLYCNSAIFNEGLQFQYLIDLMILVMITSVVQSLSERNRGNHTFKRN